MIGIVFRARDVTGRVRVDFDEGTTDGARWCTIDETHALPRIELVDVVLGLI